MQLYSRSTDKEITVWWEKAENAPEEYGIIVNGEEMCRVKKTHAAIKCLQPDTLYRIRIEPSGLEAEVRTGSRKRLLDVTTAPYCAAGDGETMNTAALQAAINDCGAEDAVYIPKGVFLTGALRLHSDMELYLADGAVLKGSEKAEDYLPWIASRFEGIERQCYQSLLNLGELDHEGGYNCTNVLIHGQGTIEGGGKKLAEDIMDRERHRLKEYIQALGDKIGDYENENTIPGRARGRLIQMSNCQNIWISGLLLKNGSSWNVHMIYSDEIVTNGCRIYSRNIWNGDGWDPDSSTNCTVFDTVFETEDDGIAIKSGKNPEGNRIGRPAEHIRIFDCRYESGGGIAIGSEMSGGISDVCIWDCDMGNTRCGIIVKGTEKRGGYIREIHARDSRVSGIRFQSVTYNDDGEPAPCPPVFENCSFTGMYLTDTRSIPSDYEEAAPAIELRGFGRHGHGLKNIVFRDIIIGSFGAKGAKRIALDFCEGISLCNISTEI